MKFQFKSLQTRFVVVTLLLGAVLSLPVTILFTHYASGKERASAIDYLENQASVLSNQIKGLCDEMMQNLIMITTDESVLFWLDGPDNPFYQAQWNNRSYRLLGAVRGNNPSKQCYLMRSDGWLLSSQRMENATDVQADALYRQAQSSDGGLYRWVERFVSPVMGDGGSFALVQRLTGRGVSAIPIGSAAVTMDWSVLDGMLAGSTFVKEGNLLILGEQGEILYAAQPVDNFSLASVHGDQYEVDGAQYIGVKKVLPYTDWTLLCMGSYGALVGSQMNARIPVLAGTAIQLLIFIMLTYLLVGSIIRPLKHLSQIMQSADAQGYLVKAPEERADEIGQIGRSFNKMTSTMLENHVLRRQAELSALQAQIDPHFLYNSLESIKAMANEQGNESIRIMVEKLGGMFRYNLNRDHRDVVTLREELDHARNYLYMQQVRHGARLLPVVEADAATLGLMIPRFTIQPLVENCCVHALKHQIHALTLRVSSVLDQGKVIIRVLDDGIGASDERIAALSEMIRSGQIDVEATEHIGLINVSRRLEIYYKGNCEMRVFRPQEGGFCVEMVIPILVE